MPLITTLLIAGLLPFNLLAVEPVTLTPPPQSLQQWYKPANKRQVWLHTMFTLRRAMQATQEYAALEDPERMVKWANKFAKAYRSLPEMVPEWADEIDLDKLALFEQASAKADYTNTMSALRKLGTTCRSCHNEHKAVTVAVMRGPDFSKATLGNSETLEDLAYGKAMERMSTAVNRIKIGAVDKRWHSAEEAAEQLKRMLADLGDGCGNCHKDDYPRERILGKATQQKLGELDSALSTKDVKTTGRLLGHLGYTVCARCHAVHRTLSDLRTALSP